MYIETYRLWICPRVEPYIDTNMYRYKYVYIDTIPIYMEHVYRYKYICRYNSIYTCVCVHICNV